VFFDITVKLDRIANIDTHVKQGQNSGMVGVRQFDEDEVLERALDVFWTRGLSATSMQELAEATGVLRGSLYNAYKDKEALFLHAFRVYRDKVLAEARTALDQPRIDDALRKFFDFTIASMTSGTPTRGCLTTKTATDDSAASPEVRAALRGLLDELQSMLMQRLSTAEALRRLTLPPLEAARLLLTLTRGIVVMERVYGDRRRLRSTANSLIKVLLTDRG
jgi:TetR/AcrR family transcriptional repressor of nem operon